MIFFFKLKTANEMRISDGSSDVCSSVLADLQHLPKSAAGILVQRRAHPVERFGQHGDERAPLVGKRESSRQAVEEAHAEPAFKRSEEHTSELQSLMRISYAVFCLKKKNTTNHHYKQNTNSTSRTK